MKQNFHQHKGDDEGKYVLVKLCWAASVALAMDVLKERIKCNTTLSVFYYQRVNFGGGG